MLCKNCGTNIPDYSIFCLQCGSKLETQEIGIDMSKKFIDKSLFCITFTTGLKDAILDFEIKNISGKEIKYIRFNIDYINSVGDKLDHRFSEFIQIVGPIANEETATLKTKLRIMLDDNSAKVISKLYIEEITIVYMDGTSQSGYYNRYIEKELDKTKIRSLWKSVDKHSYLLRGGDEE